MRNPVSVTFDSCDAAVRSDDSSKSRFLGSSHHSARRKQLVLQSRTNTVSRSAAGAWGFFQSDRISMAKYRCATTGAWHLVRRSSPAYYPPKIEIRSEFLRDRFDPRRSWQKQSPKMPAAKPTTPIFSPDWLLRARAFTAFIIGIAQPCNGCPKQGGTLSGLSPWRLHLYLRLLCFATSFIKVSVRCRRPVLR